MKYGIWMSGESWAHMTEGKFEYDWFKDTDRTFATNTLNVAFILRERYQIGSPHCEYVVRVKQ